MNIALIQAAFAADDINGNTRIIAEAYEKAAAAGAEVVAAPLQAVCGFKPGRRLQSPAYVKAYCEAAEALIAATGSTLLVFDIPLALRDGGYAPLFIAARNGQAERAAGRLAFQLPDGRKALVCAADEAHVHTEADNLRPDLLLLADCHALVIDKEAERDRRLLRAAAAAETTVYVNQAGERDYHILTGGSAIFADYGQKRTGLPLFAESLPHGQNAAPQIAAPSPAGRTKPDHTDQTALIHGALACGIRGYGRRNGIKSAIVGLSGGIDSAVVLPLAVEAFGADNVFGLMMPSRFSTDHSVNDAVQLARNTGIAYEIIAIEPLYKSFLQQLAPIFKNTPFGLAEENLQARIRGNLLMAVSNKKGGLVLNTSNKSESACGYGTLYGDLVGGLSVIGDLYKSQVYNLARHLNRERETVPPNCIAKAPSAELRPNQKDSDSLPDYDLMERILRGHLEQNLGVAELVAQGLPQADVEKVLRLLRNSAYKRLQTPPVLRLTDTVLCDYQPF
ncbi:MAG: NAD(+) synthase [Bacteroidales bacterium]|nr:NAD(+) synthase [Bacteroidales bacterium]